MNHKGLTIYLIFNILEVQLNICLEQFNSISVGTRQGSLKLEARGLFKGAKVIRGPDWEWKQSETGSEMEGEVTEITGWSDDTLNDAVRVAWKNGPKGNIYRLGTNGKVCLLLSFAFFSLFLSE